MHVPSLWSVAVPVHSAWLALAQASYYLTLGDVPLELDPSDKVNDFGP